MSQSYTLRTSKGSALTHAELDNNFSALGISSGVRFGALGVGATEGAAGTILATATVTAYSSDERLKTNFIPIANAIEKLFKIGGYEFDWNEEVCAELEFPYINKHEHGVKAQEIQKVIPDAVSLAPFDQGDEPGVSKSGEHYLTVDYARIVPLLIEAIKEQQQIITSQENRLTILEAKLAKLVE